MKKILFLFVMVFAFTMCFSINADANVVTAAGSVVTNSIDSVYHDGRAMVDTLYHDGKAVVGTVYTDLKDGAVGIYPDVRAALISIGKAIGVAAEHVYTVLVKKYFVIGVKQLGICLLGLIAMIVGFIGWKKATPVGQPITYRVIVPLIFMITGLITMCNVNYDDMLMGLINPEYGAINYILEYTKDLVK
jgi:hypothetical protein